MSTPLLLWWLLSIRSHCGATQTPPFCGQTGWCYLLWSTESTQDSTPLGDWEAAPRECATQPYSPPSLTFWFPWEPTTMTTRRGFDSMIRRCASQLRTANQRTINFLYIIWGTLYTPWSHTTGTLKCYNCNNVTFRYEYAYVRLQY